MAEKFGLGDLAAGVLFGMIILSLAVGYITLGLDSILGFRLACSFARPLGASFGDPVSQPGDYGGLGLGTVGTSAMFLVAMALLVAFLSGPRRGRPEA